MSYQYWFEKKAKRVWRDAGPSLVILSLSDRNFFCNIHMNFEGLKDDIVKMLAGERIRINIGTFSNDMTTLQSVQWTGKKCSDPSGVLFCKGILHGDPGTSDRKRICRCMFYSARNPS